MMPIPTFLIVTLSDRAHRGEYEDLSGPKIEEMLRHHYGVVIIETHLIPDDPDTLRDELKEAAEYDAIFTTGGTGIGPRDITPDVVKEFLTREIPGIMEFIRVKHGEHLPSALLSRSIAGLINQTPIYTLPGSVKAVAEYMEEILKTLDHTLEMIKGEDTH